MKKNQILFATALSLLTNALNAQSVSKPANDFMTNIGKIYVVVAVLVIIFVGLVFFLISVERRISKIEQQLQEDAASKDDFAR